MLQLDFPRDAPLIPKRCIFIVITGNGETLALSASNEDKYAPRKTGLFDVGVTTWLGKESGDKMQMWWFDDKDHSLHNFGHEESDAILFEGYNKNLVLYRNLKRDNQKFSFGGSSHFWRNDHTKRAMTVAHAMFANGSNVVTSSVDDNHVEPGVKWDIYYCSNEPTN